MSAALTNRQKVHLARLAWRAQNRVEALARGRGEEVAEVGAEEWRHAEVVKACGKKGLRCCGQGDYKAVEAHFLELLGEHGAAFAAEVRAATEDRRQAEAVLVRECAKAGVKLAYAEAICQRQFRLGLYDASERQIWCLVYTVRNRAAARRRTTEDTEGVAA